MFSTFVIFPIFLKTFWFLALLDMLIPFGDKPVVLVIVLALVVSCGGSLQSFNTNGDHRNPLRLQN